MRRSFYLTQRAMRRVMEKLRGRRGASQSPIRHHSLSSSTLVHRTTFKALRQEGRPLHMGGRSHPLGRTRGVRDRCPPLRYLIILRDGGHCSRGGPEDRGHSLFLSFSPPHSLYLSLPHSPLSLVTIMVTRRLLFSAPFSLRARFWLLFSAPTFLTA